MSEEKTHAEVCHEVDAALRPILELNGRMLNNWVLVACMSNLEPEEDEETEEVYQFISPGLLNTHRLGILHWALHSGAFDE